MSHRTHRAPILAALALALLTSCREKQGGAEHADASHDHDHAAEPAHAGRVTLTPEAIDRYGVRLEAAQLWALRPTVIAPARVAFNTEAMAHVGSSLRGRAVDVKVRLGDTVKAGDALVIVESPELGEAQADFLQKQSAVLTARPAVELSNAAWDRAKTLYEQSRSISLTEVQRREAEHRAAVASVKAAEAAATASGSRLLLLSMSQDQVATLASDSRIDPRHTIRAAIDGQVVQREVTLGELVGPDRESLLVLADTRSLWVLADVPESRLAGIAIGAAAWIAIGPATGRGSGASVPKFEGQVAFIAPLVDPATRTAQVRIEVPAALEGRLTLRPGMFAQAEIVALSPVEAEPAPVVAVPDEAIQTIDGRPAIFVPVAKDPNSFTVRAVTVGKPVGSLVPIYAGLVEGERFVIAGTFILKAELGKGSAAHEH